MRASDISTGCVTDNAGRWAGTAHYFEHKHAAGIFSREAPGLIILDAA